MSPSIFSRRENAPENAPAEAAQPPAPTDQVEPTAPSFRETVGSWRAELAKEIEQEVGEHPVTRLVLSQAHPGGLAQLYAEHPTRLSNLVRDPASLQVTKTAAMDVLRQAEHMQDRHGAVVIHLAIGTASWDDNGTARTTPILLRPIDLRIDEEGELTLTLRPGIEISNRLLAVLGRQGVHVEPRDVLDLVRTQHGFSPAPALQMIREVSKPVSGIELRDSLTIGIFSHPISPLLRELGAPQWLSLSRTVRALAGDRPARSALDYPLPEPNPFDRDPWDEKGLGEQSPEMADVVEAATGDKSVFVDVPPGGNVAQMVASLAVEHAAQGRKVLVVTGRGNQQNPILDELEMEGAVGVANIVGSSVESARTVQENLQHALNDASDPFDADMVDKTRTRLRRARSALASYTESLHQPFPQWGVSAFDALQTLTDLTSVPASPKTKVRLSEHALAHLAHDEGAGARANLQKADELGVFSDRKKRNWWNGVELATEQQVQDMLTTLRALDRELLPAIRNDMKRVSQEVGLPPTKTIAEWLDRLDALENIRDTLDVFVPAVFERSAADMVVATASKDWRKSHGINLTRSSRRNLVKQAKALVRPGRFVEDIHGQLILVQERREAWRRIGGGQHLPVLPEDVQGLLGVGVQFKENLEAIQPHLAPAFGDLFALGIDEFSQLVASLIDDPAGARELPERIKTLNSLEEAELTDLVLDLQKRGVQGKMIDLELDLAWWASLLGLMLAKDPRLGGFGPSSLQEALTEIRLLEEAQVQSLGPEARHRVSRLRQAAIASRPEVYAETELTLSAQTSAATYYARVPLAWDLMPVVITSPTLVPHIVPWGRHVDVVLLAGVEDLPLAELVPVIARGQQVVVVQMVGPQTQGGNRAGTALADVLPHLTVKKAQQRLNDKVVRLLAKYDLNASGISIPGRRSSGGFQLVKVDGRAMPAPGVHAIESSTAEVDEIIKLVRAHYAEDDPKSLGVIALNQRHAERLATRLARETASDKQLAKALKTHPAEPFVLTGPTEAGNLRRDRIIISTGFAKTPHGRVIHDFGEYSQPGGDALLAQVLQCVREDLTVVTALEPGEVEEGRLRQPGARMLLDLIRLSETKPAGQEVAWPTLELAPDHLLVDLAERLYGLGLNVVPNLGLPGGMRIPLGIGHPEVPGELLVAILTDDETYVKEPSLRVKDWLQPRLLEQQGWKVRTELSMAVFIDPNREAEAIVQLVLDAVDEHYERNPHLRPEPPVEEIPESEEAPIIAEADDDEANQVVESASTQESDEADDDVADRAVDPSTTSEEPAASKPVRRRRTPRPPIATGLPLAAYGDDQLDEVAAWIYSDNPDLTVEEAMEEMRSALTLTRRGAQSDAVLRNVVRRNRPAVEKGK